MFLPTQRFIDMRIILVLFSLICSQILSAQEEDVFYSFDTPLTINLDEDSKPDDVEIVKKKKKRLPKNTYYGVKTKKGFTRIGFGEAMTIELFNFLKEDREPDVLVRDYYWYDFKQRIIRKGKGFDPEKGALLHGPYKKMQGTQVLDSGVFYFGLKHGTWMYHDKDDILLDKEKYYMGWPRESRVSYYDRERKKMKEIIPVEFGDREGNYFYFFENGRIAVRGEYKWGYRVGDWIEYFPNGRQKKIIRYPADPFSDETPYTYKEYDSRGRELYDYRRASF